MSARQRLRAVLEARRSSALCWRCSRGLPRHDPNIGSDGRRNRSLLVSSADSVKILQETTHLPASIDLPIHRYLVRDNFIRKHAVGLRIFEARVPIRRHVIRPRIKYHIASHLLQEVPKSTGDIVTNVLTDDHDSNLVQPESRVKISRIPTKQSRSGRVIKTRLEISTAPSSEVVSQAQQYHQVVENDQLADGELELVLDAFKDLDTSRPSPDECHNSLAPKESSESTISAIQQYTARAQNSVFRPNLASMPHPYPSMSRRIRHYVTAANQAPPTDNQLGSGMLGFDNGCGSGIREHLKLWQEQQELVTAGGVSVHPLPRGPAAAKQNLLTQSGEDDSFKNITEYNDMDEQEDVDIRLDDGVTDIFQNQAFLRRGDLVELRTNDEPILAIVVKNLITQCQLYTMRGEWLHREINTVKFASPGFVHPEELKGILPYLPAGEITEDRLDRLQPMDRDAPRDAGSNLLGKMSAFSQSADSVFRNNADRLNRAYALTAPRHERAGRSLKSLKEIATNVLQKEASELTPPMLWAVHRALISTQNIIFDTVNFRQNPVYEFLPQQSLKNITRVREWVREFQESVLEDMTASSKTDLASSSEIRSQNPITTFVKKARAAIQQSRLTRPLSIDGGIGPSKVMIKPMEPNCKTYKEYSSLPFNDDEKMIIQYFDAWVTSRYINVRSNLSSLGPMILRAVGMYNEFELDEKIGCTLLQELGVITPWENRTIYKIRSLRLPGHDTVSEKTTRLQSTAKLALDSFRLRDSMEGLRKDWGNLPVFCIDSAGTLERDDGVSVEPVEGNSSEYWVHIMVANPSAFIAPQSATAQFAAQLTESVYFPERKYPMLDPTLASEYFSLDKNRPCLTFSARMTIEGDILERKIVPGRVHNVHYLTHPMVGRCLGIDSSEESETVSVLTVGGAIPTRPKDRTPTGVQDLDPSYMGMLRALADLGAANRRRRARADAPVFPEANRFTSVYPKVFLSKTTPRAFHVNSHLMRRFEGDPIISLERETTSSSLVATMVGDLMVIAGEIAASWCNARGVPIPFRGLLRNPEPPISAEDFKQTVMDPALARNGRIEQHDLLRYGKLIGETAISATPLEHFALGVPAYCKATSPLRRYVDLFAHWQIEAALRREAETGTLLIGSTDDSYLPFSRHAVEEFAGTALHSEKKIHYAKMAATRHWIVQALHRAFYFREAPLPKLFKVVVTDKANGWPTGFMTWLNVKCQLHDNEVTGRAGGLRRGDVYEARIKFVDPYHVNIQMEPVRLLERDRVRLAAIGEGTRE